MKFLLDANFLMIPGQFGVDIFSELLKFGKPELYTLDSVKKELERLSGGRSADARAARLALSLIEQKNVRVLRSSGLPVDRELEALSRKGYVVCTQDKHLKKRIFEGRRPVVTMRQKKYLTMLSLPLLGEDS